MREEISPVSRKIAAQIGDLYGECMTLGKARPKFALSFTTRRIRLGVANHGAPSAYTAPSKDQPARDIVQSVVAAVEQWRDGYPPNDDMTVVALKITLPDRP